MSFGSCRSGAFLSLSDKIEKECIGKAKIKGTTFNDLRKMLYKEGLLPFVQRDTLYFLETHEFETDRYIGRIWTKLKAIDYVFNDEKFFLDSHDLFTEYTIKKIEEWDIESIRKEEGGHQVAPERYVNGVRAFWDGKKYKIQCVTFRKFFYPERDR
ncbi:MAG: hypothetical protein QM731_09890 [Chitinophagaceae bacterium]